MELFREDHFYFLKGVFCRTLHHQVHLFTPVHHSSLVSGFLASTNIPKVLVNFLTLLKFDLRSKSRNIGGFPHW